MLAHAGTKRRLQRLPRVFLRILHRIADVQAVGDGRRECGSERATGTVIASRQALPVVAAHDAVLAVKRIGHLRGIFVGAGDQHVFAAGGQEPARALGEIDVFLALFLRQAPRLDAVGSNDGALWYQQLAQCRDHLVGHEFVAPS